MSGRREDCNVALLDGALSLKKKEKQKEKAKSFFKTGDKKGSCIFMPKRARDKKKKLKDSGRNSRLSSFPQYRILVHTVVQGTQPPPSPTTAVVAASTMPKSYRTYVTNGIHSLLA